MHDAQVTSDGATPLFVGSQNGHTAVVTLLLDNNAEDANIQNALTLTRLLNSTQ